MWAVEYFLGIGGIKLNIEDIKKKVEDYKAELIKSRECCDTVDLSDEVLYLLSIIEQAEKVLTHFAEEPYLISLGYSTKAIEALKVIRGC